MLPSPPVILDPCLQRSPWKQTWRLFGGTPSFQRMHLQQKTESKAENGVKAERILKNLQSEKCDKFVLLAWCNEGLSVRVSTEMILYSRCSSEPRRRNFKAGGKEMWKRSKVYRHKYGWKRRPQYLSVAQKRTNMNSYCFRKWVCFIRYQKWWPTTIRDF